LLSLFTQIIDCLFPSLNDVAPRSLANETRLNQMGRNKSKDLTNSIKCPYAMCMSIYPDTFHLE